jgi:hypothetical protein
MTERFGPARHSDAGERVIALNLDGALEIPAEVNLGGLDPTPVEGEDLGIPASSAISPRHLVGHDYFVAGLHQSHKFELLSLPGTGPAALEISRAIQGHVSRTGEREPFGQDALDKVTIARREGKVELSCSLSSIIGWHLHLPG